MGFRFTIDFATTEAWLGKNIAQATGDTIKPGVRGATCGSWCCPGLHGIVPGWPSFASSKYHYCVQYPASWFLFTTELRPALDFLDILNFPPSERIEGVVLKKGGAEITVARASSNVGSLGQWISERVQGAEHVELRTIRLPAGIQTQCRRMEKVTSEQEVGPNTFLALTDYYCETARGLFGVSLSNWRGDPRQNEYRSFALRMALTLQVW